jgi:hypothetical protein
MFTSNGHFPIIDSNEMFLVIMMHPGMIKSSFCGFLKYVCECDACVSLFFKRNMTKFLEGCEF